MQIYYCSVFQSWSRSCRNQLKFHGPPFLALILWNLCPIPPKLFVWLSILGHWNAYFSDVRSKSCLKILQTCWTPSEQSLGNLLIMSAYALPILSCAGALSVQPKKQRVSRDRNIFLSISENWVSAFRPILYVWYNLVWMMSSDRLTFTSAIFILHRHAALTRSDCPNLQFIRLRKLTAYIASTTDLLDWLICHVEEILA